MYACACVRAEVCVVSVYKPQIEYIIYNANHENISMRLIIINFLFRPSVRPSVHSTFIPASHSVNLKLSFLFVKTAVANSLLKTNH